MAERMTQAICDTMEVKPDAVRIIINDMKNENFAIGGTLVCDDPSMQVRPKGQA